MWQESELGDYINMTIRAPLILHTESSIGLP